MTDTGTQRSQVPHLPVAIVGAGPVGLTTALDLHHHGIEAGLFDQDDTVCDGSRAIAWAQRTLEIFDRLGVGEAIRQRGTTWKLGRVFWRDRLAYAFDLQPDQRSLFPAFVNVPQFEVERLLLGRLDAVGAPPIHWSYRLTSMEPCGDRTALTFDTPDGPHYYTCDKLIAADGARSTVRRLLGLSFQGQSFTDKFLIADVRMADEFPTERWFWFDPPFNPGESALLHRQPDGVWRIDLQLGAAADPEIERQPARVIGRVAAMLGPDRPFELDWVSVYTFHCRRLHSFKHGNIFFVGDSAHQVSPFGARGGNSGIQDVDNLVWKLALVMRGQAGDRLLESYDNERIAAADDNMAITSRSMAFISPKGESAKVFRDAVLELSGEHEFARQMVNSGRLSRASAYPASPLNGPDEADGSGIAPGCPCMDVPLTRRDGSATWLLREVGTTFTLLVFAGDEPALAIPARPAQPDATPLKVIVVGRTQDADLQDSTGLAAARYGAQPGTVYLIRPDQHVLARFRHLDQTRLAEALSLVHGVSRQDQPAMGAWRLH